MKKTVFITGASSGIGRATARIFGSNGFNLVICGRRQERLQELEKEFGSKVKVESLVFDVSSNDEVGAAIKKMKTSLHEIDILVNNAGNAHGLSSIFEGDIEDWDNMIDINVKGLLYVSRAILPAMVARKSGHVINIGSIAGFEAYPNGNVYNASKFAVRAINKAMRLDVLEYGIRVGAVNPGLVETEFSLVRFKGDQERSSNVYKGFEALQAEDIADAVYYMATRPAHVNIEDIHIFPTAQAGATRVIKS